VGEATGVRKGASSRLRSAFGRGDYDVAVLGKALDLLEVLEAGEELGLSELSARTGVSKPSAFRVLTTLETRGYVAKDAAHRKYRPGPRLIALSCSVVSGLSVVQHARPVIERLHAEFGETVNLGALSDGEVLYLDMLESTLGLRMAARVGARDPLHSTALGKALLAAMPADDLGRLLGRYRWVRRTRRTITTRAALERELALVRERGYAIDDGENEDGARCVGVAIRDARRPLAALSVSGPASRLPGSRIRQIGEQLKVAASEIAQRMGLRGSPVAVGR
jgi:IclR family acetate operon transcriptional repressor